METKIYAVRRPEEAKGVYLTADEMKQMQRKYPNGFSVKTFEKEEVELAKQWAGVKGTVGTPIEIVKKQVTPKHPIQAILNSYQAKGYRHFQLKLTSGDSIYLTPEDVVYIPDKNYNASIIDSIDLTDYRKDSSVRARSASDFYYKREVVLASLKKATMEQLSSIKDAIQWKLIDVLERTEIEYYDNFILLTNFNCYKDELCTKDELFGSSTEHNLKFFGTYTDSNGVNAPMQSYLSFSYSHFAHKNQTICINVNQIASIKPFDLGLNTAGVDRIPNLNVLVKAAKQELQV